jgi:hypothetical protein
MTYLTQLGIAFDMMLNAILGGMAGQTISLRAALGAKAGSRVGCVLCRFLAWLVQPNHCADQLNNTPMKPAQYFRAFVGLVVLAVSIAAPAIFIVRHAF